MPATTKASVPRALREEVWRTYMGKTFEGKCRVTWCSNRINVFDFEVGHNIPESKGGALVLTNLRPICGRCNKSMGNKYTIDEWNTAGKPEGVETACCGCF
jgi:5-methylcytosine-specific restriction endonuclease McrA